ncbi:MAG: hypothetical protein K8E24_015130 [Methanobacterium paludis]|nr:hypothetical protein [Methanobacterium paludis]
MVTSKDLHRLREMMNNLEQWELFDELMKEGVPSDVEPIHLQKDQVKIWKDSVQLRPKLRRQVILAHRGYGKSWLEGAHRFINMITIPGWQSYTVYPKLDQGKYSLRYTKQFIEECPLTRWMKKKAFNWGETYINLSNKSFSFLISPSSRTATGYHVDFGYCGEAARWNDDWDEIFKSAIVPMTNRKNGVIWMTSSAYGQRGFFYEEHEKGDTQERRVYNLDVDSTGIYNDADKSMFKDDLGAMLYRQEYECQFIGSAETFIQLYIINKQSKDIPQYKWIDVVNGYAECDAIGLDPGQNFDKFGISGIKRIGTGKYDLVMYTENTNDAYTIMTEQIKKAQKNNPRMKIFLESTGNQIMYLEWLRSEGVRVEEVSFSPQTKMEYYQRLERCLRNGTLYLPKNNDLCMSELKYIPYQMRGSYVHFPDQALGGHHALHSLVVIDIGTGKGRFGIKGF